MNKNRILVTIGLLFSCFVAATIVKGQTSNDYSEKASIASLNGNHEEAVALYTKAIELKPYDLLYALRSDEYETLGKLDLALADLNKAIELHIYDLDDKIERRGQLYVHIGKYDLALADFASLLKKDPTRSTVYNYRSWAYLIINKPDLAYADVVKFLNSEYREDGDMVDAVTVGYWSLRKTGKAAEAKKFIDEWAPRLEMTLVQSKFLLYLKGDLTSAQLLAAQTDQSWAHFYIGEMVLLAGDSSAASNHFKFFRDKGGKYSFEYDLAVVELSRIAGSKPNK